MGCNVCGFEPESDLQEGLMVKCYSCMETVCDCCADLQEDKLICNICLNYGSGEI